MDKIEKISIYKKTANISALGYFFLTVFFYKIGIDVLFGITLGLFVFFFLCATAIEVVNYAIKKGWISDEAD